MRPRFLVRRSDRVCAAQGGSHRATARSKPDPDLAAVLAQYWPESYHARFDPKRCAAGRRHRCSHCYRQLLQPSLEFRVCRTCTIHQTKPGSAPWLIVAGRQSTRRASTHTRGTGFPGLLIFLHAVPKQANKADAGQDASQQCRVATNPTKAMALPHQPPAHLRCG